MTRTLGAYFLPRLILPVNLLESRPLEPVRLIIRRAKDLGLLLLCGHCECASTAADGWKGSEKRCGIDESAVGHGWERHLYCKRADEGRTMR